MLLLNIFCRDLDLDDDTVGQYYFTVIGSKNDIPLVRDGETIRVTNENKGVFKR